MNYNLGQTYESGKVIPGNSNYSTKITEGVKVDNIAVKILNTTLYNKGIFYNFKKDTAYFLTFSIETGKPCNIRLKLKTNSNDVQFLKTISCNTTSSSLSIVISAKNDFNFLEFEIERLDNSEIVTTLTDVTLYEIKNTITNKTYKRIGLQAEPGSIFTINNEEVRMGKTGMFEFKNDNILIYSFSCIAAENGFILDYIEMTKE